MAATPRTVSLTERQIGFVDSQVSSGRHGSVSEVVREALRRYQDDVRREQAHLDYLRRLGDEGEADLAAGRYVDVEQDRLGEFLSTLGRRVTG